MTTQQISGSEDQEQGAIVLLAKHAVIHWRSLPFSVGGTHDTIGLVELTG
jgi:hypothetical protein